MAAQNKDAKNILKHYVKRQSKSELEFIEEQKKSGIKVCERICHQRSRDGKDKLVIETQLSSTNDSSDSSGNRACSLLRVDNCYDQSGSSLTNSDYFIKELKISHVGKSKSLDEDQIIRPGEVQKTSVTTVVGTRSRPFETVYQAVVEHSQGGRHLLQQQSFVRQTTSEFPSSYHSLPGRITNSVSLPYASKGNNFSRKKSNKNRTWASIFSVHKKGKKEKEELKEIDKLAKQRVSETVESRKETMTMTTTTTTESPLSFDREMPFKSFKIGDHLQPMKKKKKIPYFLRSMLSPTNSLPRTGFWSHRLKDHTSKKENLEDDNLYGSIDRRGIEGHATRVVATLSQDNEEEDFSYRTNAFNGNDSVDCRSRHKSGSENISNFHFDMTISDSNTRRKSAAEEQICECETRRMDLIARTISCIHATYKPNIDEIKNELETFDKTTFHFKDCLFNTPTLRQRKGSGDSHRQSRLSLYQSCEQCENADDQLHPEISIHLLPLINRLEDSDEINFNEDHLSFFLSAKCYKEFEEGMRQAIGFKCSSRNLAHLHYVTRKVVRHIGDPNEEDNEHIRRIMYFSETFLTNHFMDHIKDHGSVEEFLIHCSNHDLD